MNDDVKPVLNLIASTATGMGENQAFSENRPNNDPVAGRLQDVDDRQFDGSQHFNPPNPMLDAKEDVKLDGDADRGQDGSERGNQDDQDRRGVRSRDREGPRSRDRDRGRRRSRSPVRNRPGGGGSGGGGGGGDRRFVPERARRCQIHVSNIPFEVKWQELKDVFKEEVGGVRFCDVLLDDSGKSRGSGVVEFESPDLVETAIKKMHRFLVRDRKIVVRREAQDRDDGKESKDDRGQRRRSPPARGRRSDSYSDDRGRDRPLRFENTFGLSEEFLRQLGVEPPLINRVSVTNLVFHVEHKKLYETFKLAGKIRWLALLREKGGRSKGRAVVEYDHPLEAVQAISLFNNQLYYDRKISVQLDHDDAITRNMKLPPGLERVGKGLGVNGTVLCDVALNFRELDEAKKKDQTGSDMPGMSIVAPGPQNPGYALPTIPMASQQSMGANPLSTPSAVQALNALQSLLQAGSLLPRLGNVGGGSGQPGMQDVGPSGSMGGPGLSGQSSSGDLRDIKPVINQGGLSGMNRYGNQGMNQPSWSGSY